MAEQKTVEKEENVSVFSEEIKDDQTKSGKLIKFETRDPEKIPLPEEEYMYSDSLISVIAFDAGLSSRGKHLPWSTGHDVVLSSEINENVLSNYPILNTKHPCHFTAIVLLPEKQNKDGLLHNMETYVHIARSTKEYTSHHSQLPPKSHVQLMETENKNLALVVNMFPVEKEEADIESFRSSPENSMKDLAKFFEETIKSNMLKRIRIWLGWFLTNIYHENTAKYFTLMRNKQSLTASKSARTEWTTEIDPTLYFFSNS